MKQVELKIDDFEFYDKSIVSALFVIFEYQDSDRRKNLRNFSLSKSCSSNKLPSEILVEEFKLICFETIDVGY